MRRTTIKNREVLVDPGFEPTTCVSGAERVAALQSYHHRYQLGASFGDSRIVVDCIHTVEINADCNVLRCSQVARHRCLLSLFCHLLFSY